jgi:hypothetical protein
MVLEAHCRGCTAPGLIDRTATHHTEPRPEKSHHAN